VIQNEAAIAFLSLEMFVCLPWETETYEVGVASSVTVSAPNLVTICRYPKSGKKGHTDNRIILYANFAFIRKVVG
jgi:hypothetical protein